MAACLFDERCEALPECGLIFPSPGRAHWSCSYFASVGGGAPLNFRVRPQSGSDQRKQHVSPRRPP